MLVVLANAYTALGQAWKEALENPVNDSSAPYAALLAGRGRWEPSVVRGDGGAGDPEPSNIGATRSTLGLAAESTAVSAAIAIQAHLALLCRAYWSGPPGSPDNIISSPAIYPPARAVLEASAVIRWALDPTLTVDVRAERAAEFMLWSQAATGRADAEWQHIVSAAGFDVRSTRRRPDVFQLAGQASPLTLTKMIHAAHGDSMTDVYRLWSTASHPDPIDLTEGALYVGNVVGGIGVARFIREDDHVEVAALVADIVANTVHTISAYFGRIGDSAARCRAIECELSDFLATVTDLVDYRNGRAIRMGKLDGDGGFKIEWWRGRR